MWRCEPKKFRAIVGVTPDYVQQLGRDLDTALTGAVAGVTKLGRPCALSAVYLLTFFFLWMRHYLTEELLAFVVGIGVSTASAYIHHVTRILHAHYRSLNLVRFLSYKERLQQGCLFQDVNLTTVIDCSEQEQLDSAGE